MLTVRDVAERLNVSQSLVYQLVESGHLASHRIGTGRGTIRVSEEDLSKYVAASRRQGRDEEPSRKAPRPRLKHIRL